MHPGQGQSGIDNFVFNAMVVKAKSSEMGAFGIADKAKSRNRRSWEQQVEGSKEKPWIPVRGRTEQ